MSTSQGAGVGVARLLAVAFLLPGILGFIPNPIVGAGALFHTNLAHNLVHILTAAGFAFFATKGHASAVMFTKIFGFAYFGVAILGFITLAGAEEGFLLGFIHINQADNYLHVGLAVTVLALGFFAGSRETTTPSPA